ncbi:MAG: DUF1638 domain-containing protein, partial [Candidatus Electrothrix sp. AR3]|nr:DUF1638 domain-containing protein [Candidatus Electrothrix sp. AR3]
MKGGGIPLPGSKDMPLTFCFLVCDHFYRETKAGVESLSGVEAEVRAFPARCGHPPITGQELTDCLHDIDVDVVEIFGSYCLHAVDDWEFKFSSCTVRKLEQCFHLVCSPTLVDAQQRAGDYLLTSGWLARWRQHLAVWGFDQAIAKEFFAQSIHELVLLDTGTDKKAKIHLEHFSEFIGRPARKVSIGLEYFILSLGKIVEEHWRLDLIRQREAMQCLAAESAMTLDLLGAVTKANTEPEVFARIRELFRMLFASRRVYCLPITGKGLSSQSFASFSAAEEQKIKQFYAAQERQYQLNESGDGFFLRIGREGKTFALLYIHQVAFPQYITSYLNAALNVSGVCSLAVEHVRTLKKLLDTSWLAGKAEVATEVLHNVGNTLNSISVSSEHLHKMVEKSSSATLPGIVQLLQQHQNNLGDFWSKDARGQKLPLYFTQLSEQLIQEKENILKEMRRQFKHIQQAGQIIRAQQAAVGGAGLVEQVDLPSLVEESLEIFEQEMKQEQITVEYDYTSSLIIQSERYKIVQVIRNLLSNAIESLTATKRKDKRILLRLYSVEEACDKQKKVMLEVIDNGQGISAEVQEQIFSFGFTTKEGGHGFGL